MIKVGGLLSDSGVQVSCVAKCVIRKLGRLLRLDKRDVLFEEVSSDELLLTCRQVLVIDSCAFAVLLIVLVFKGGLDHVVVSEALVNLGATLEPMVSNHALSDASIHLRVLVIKHDKQQVKSGEQGISKADVPCHRLVSLVVTPDRVGSSDHRAPSVETSVDSCLRNRDGLLFHNFVNGHSISIVHFIELIDANDAAVSQYHRTSFQVSLTCVFINAYSGCQTYT